MAENSRSAHNGILSRISQLFSFSSKKSEKSLNVVNNTGNQCKNEFGQNNEQLTFSVEKNALKYVGEGDNLKMMGDSDKVELFPKKDRFEHKNAAGEDEEEIDTGEKNATFNTNLNRKRVNFNFEPQEQETQKQKQEGQRSSTTPFLSSSVSGAQNSEITANNIACSSSSSSSRETNSKGMENSEYSENSENYQNDESEDYKINGCTTIFRYYLLCLGTHLGVD